jgi:hypothetical protein
MQSVPITTKVVSFIPAHGEVYSIQHYVIKLVSDLWQVSGFLWVIRFPPPIKLTAMFEGVMHKVLLYIYTQGPNIKAVLVFREWVRVMLFNATFNNISAISWQSCLLHALSMAFS